MCVRGGEALFLQQVSGERINAADVKVNAGKMSDTEGW
jgi:hypothetical protein